MHNLSRDECKALSAASRRIEWRLVTLAAALAICGSACRNWNQEGPESLPADLQELLGIAREVDTTISAKSYRQSVTRIYFDDVHLTGAHVKRLAYFPNLRHVVFRRMTLEHDVFEQMVQLPSLQFVELPESTFQSESLRLLSTCRNLNTLSLSKVYLSGNILSALLSIKGLESLSLSSTNISDDDLQHIASLTSLRLLSLGDTGITDKGVRWLTGLELEAAGWHGQRGR